VSGRNYRCSYLHPPSWHPQTGRKRISLFLCSFFCDFLGARLFSRGTGLGGGQGELTTSRRARTADRKRTVHIFAMIHLGRVRMMVKQKKEIGCSQEAFGVE